MHVAVTASRRPYGRKRVHDVQGCRITHYMYKEMLQGRTKGGRLCATPRHTYAVAMGNTAYLSIAAKDSINTLLARYLLITVSQLSIISVCIAFGMRGWCGPEVVSPLSYEPDYRFRPCKELVLWPVLQILEFYQ